MIQMQHSQQELQFLAEVAKVGWLAQNATSPMAATGKLSSAAAWSQGDNSYSSFRQSSAPVATNTGNDLFSSFVKGSTVDQFSGSSKQVFSATSIDLPYQSLEGITNITEMERFANSETNCLQFPASLSPPACQVSSSFPTFDSCIDNVFVLKGKKSYGYMSNTTEANDILGIEPWFEKKELSDMLEDAQALMDACVPCKKESSAIVQLSPSISTEREIKRNDCSKNATKRKKKTSVTIKDDKYWERRNKNTLAARRTRQTKREKESRIQQRLKLLEIENTRLCLELSCLKEENKNFRRRLIEFVKEATVVMAGTRQYSDLCL